MIISATRRTDLPSYYGEWFVNRLKEGYVLIQNPYNSDRYSKAILTRDAVDIIVFWTKNPIPFIKYLPKIDEMGYPYYFQYTITPYGNETEKNLPEKGRLTDCFLYLSEKLGREKMVWRYDPIIVNDRYSLNYHEDMFGAMTRKLAGHANRCVISFVDKYKTVATRMGKEPFYDATDKNVYKIAEIFSTIAKEYNIDIYTCAEGVGLESYGIKHGACIEKDIIEKILGSKIDVKPDINQRAECLCVESIDIGTYNCCANGCTYCYALKSEKQANHNMGKHNPKLPVLIGEVNENAIITQRKSDSVVKQQLSWF